MPASKKRASLRAYGLRARSWWSVVQEGAVLTGMWVIAYVAGIPVFIIGPLGGIAAFYEGYNAIAKALAHMQAEEYEIRDSDIDPITPTYTGR